jgi:catechol 2,3-dioxygenase-like lactoylglutathione lyase family enzyme
MVDMHLEVDVIPVSDVDRSKQFYGRLGWRLDDDVAPGNGVRIVQFTPPGSGCSVTFGKGITAAAPGSAAGAMVVSDIVAAHQDLIGRDIEASDMWHGAPFPPEARVKGPDPKRTSYGSFFAFNDPDGKCVGCPGGHDAASWPNLIVDCDHPCGPRGLSTSELGGLALAWRDLHRRQLRLVRRALRRLRTAAIRQAVTRRNARFGSFPTRPSAPRPAPALPPNPISPRPRRRRLRTHPCR